jgi:TFIIF-interacting CTD phosphatase-like protein
MADPAPRDAEHILKFGPKNMPIKVYMRDHVTEFMEFLKKNKNSIETVLYTSGVPEYANMLVDLLDPKREVF